MNANESKLCAGYTRDQLKAAFDAVCNPSDWKGSIAAMVAGEAVMPVVEAIKFFTATVPVVELNVSTMQYLITSPGYRMGPAGDH